jgi:hypothetical protein
LAPFQAAWFQVWVSLHDKVEIFSRLLYLLLIDTIINVVLGSTWTSRHGIVGICGTTLLITDEFSKTVFIGITIASTLAQWSTMPYKGQFWE